MTQVTDVDAKEVLDIKNISSAATGLLRGRSLAGQFLAFQLMVVAVVLIAVAAVSVAQSTREFREARGQRMIAVAENMASTPIVRDRTEQAPADPFAARILAPEVDRAVALIRFDTAQESTNNFALVGEKRGRKTIITDPEGTRSSGRPL